MLMETLILWQRMKRFLAISIIILLRFLDSLLIKENEENENPDDSDIHGWGKRTIRVFSC